MNKIVKLNDGNYRLVCENGDVMTCSRWYERKTDKWHVKLPSDNPTGRTYVREEIVLNSPNQTYEFETKTEHRVGLSTGGWRSKMTDDERKLVEEAEKTIERIKKECMSRVVEKPEKGSIEDIEEQIRKLTEKLNKKKGL